MQLKYHRLGESFVAEFDVTIDGESVVIDGLNAKAVEYLLQYGFAQSLQDSIAGREKKVKDEMANADAETLANAVKSDILGQLGKRFDAILAGTIGTKVSKSKLSPFEKMAWEMFKNYVKGLGKKMPDDEEKVAKALERYVEMNRELIESRLEEQSKEIELDF